MIPRTVAVLTAFLVSIVYVSVAQGQEDPGWPRSFPVAGGKVVVHQPQVDSWDNYTTLSAWSAVEVTPSDQDEPVAGSIKITTKTKTNFEMRTVLVYDVRVEESFFFSADKSKHATLDLLVREIQAKPKTLALDRLLAMTGDQDVRAPSVEVSVDPPPLFYSDGPASLVVFDGDPLFSPIKGSDLSYAVNTNWDVFQEKGSSNLYLLHTDVWLVAADHAGPWRLVSKLPSVFDSLPDDKNFAQVRAHIPPGAAPAAPPRVFVATRPAELILTEGPPQFQTIEGTDLVEVTNTENDLFLNAADNQYYLLLSGRWFRSITLEGPWTYAGNDLPADFAAIPSDHSRAHVLASVPGTAEAKWATQQAMVPQQATVNRDEATVDVTYQGDPDFQPIEGTSVSYAANSPYDVLYVNHAYYCCYQGVWFTSASASGGWIVAADIPPEVYTIPASSPVHHVTYVQAYDQTPTTVTFGYTSGYSSIYISNGCVVYGTGYYYPPYVYWGPYYPIYYPYPYSYGGGAYYNPHTGTYWRGASAHGPYGGVGRAAAYNPRTGTYARGRAAYGDDAGTAAMRAYNPRTGARGASYQSYNDYAHWGESVVQKGDRWAHSGHYATEDGAVAGFHTSEGARGIGWVGEEGSGKLVETKDGDLYAGKDGNVYKREDGSWYKNEDGDWDPAELSEDQRAEVENRQEQTQERAKEAGENMTPEQKEQAQERQAARDNATPEQRAQAQERAQGARQNVTPEQRAQAQERARAADVEKRRARERTEKLNRDWQARNEGRRRSDAYQTWQRSGGGGGGRDPQRRSGGGRGRRR